MNAGWLLAHYEQVADAPDAISRLRRFILDLAVRGKLVEQAPNDEPASVLLKRIAAARMLVPASGRKTKKPFGDSSLTEVAFPLPAGWTSAQLSELVRVVNGRAYKKAELLESGTPVLRVGNLFTSNHWYYSDLELEEDKHCDVGDLIYAWSASFGPFIWQGPRVIYHYHIWKLPLFSEANIDKRFLYFFLLQKTKEIKGAGHGISMAHMTKEKMEQLAVPLAPLAEQHRIVAKVDELMALCDRLEAARTEREATRDRLGGAVLSRLNAPDLDPVVFRNHAAFALENLVPLTTRTDQIKSLRQTILNLAVRGKLVKQNPNDEPASELLKRRKIAVSSAMPFELPASWAWVNVGAVAVTRLGKMLDKAKNKGTPRRYLRNINVRWFDFDLSDLLEMRFEDSELSEFTLQFGDVLICEGGEPGRAAVWDGREDDIYFQKAIHRVRFLTIVDSGFFVKALRASADDGSLAEYFTGTGIKHFTGKSLAAYLFPLPPLPEQHNGGRIITKVDELIALCDRLEASLATGEDTRRRLLDALLREVLMQTADRASVVQRPVW